MLSLICFEVYLVCFNKCSNQDIIGSVRTSLSNSSGIYQPNECKSVRKVLVY